MMQAFIDESGVGQGDVLVLAGYIASTEAWSRFSSEWRSRLDMHPRIGKFKMGEMHGSEVRRERAGWFYRVIEDHALCAISCSIDIRGMLRAIDAYPWPANFEVDSFKNPYIFGFKAILHIIVQHRAQLKIDESVEFVFDDKGEKRKLLSAINRLRFAAALEDRRFLGDVSFRTDDAALPLQAADLYAYWVRQWRLESDWPAGLDQQRFPWKTSRDMPRLDWAFEEKDFLKEFEKSRDPAIWLRLGMSDEEIDAALRSQQEAIPLWKFSTRL